MIAGYLETSNTAESQTDPLTETHTVHAYIMHCKSRGGIPCRSAEQELFDAGCLLFSRGEICLEPDASYIAEYTIAGLPRD